MPYLIDSEKPVIFPKSGVISSLDDPKPQNITIGTTLETLDKSKVTLKCPATGVPKPQIVWKKDDEVIELDDRVMIDSQGSLIIVRSRASDSGRYQCQALNIGGSDFEESTITILGLNLRFFFLPYNNNSLALDSKVYVTTSVGNEFFLYELCTQY